MTNVILGRGRDVYHGNGAINWAHEHDVNHVTWAMTKVSQGLGFTDSMFPSHKVAIPKAGIAPGGYHYGDPGLNAEAQARRFLGLYKPTPGKHFVCLDLEKAPAAMSQRDVYNWRKTYSGAIRAVAPGVGYVIYLGGYAHNGSGADLAGECDAWMFPEYPGIRSFPTTYSVHVGTNTTGIPVPQIWQCSDNIGGLDGSVSIISAEQLLAPTSSGGLSVSDVTNILAAIAKIPALTLGQPIDSLRGQGTVAVRDYLAAIDLHANASATALAALTPQSIAAAIAAEIPAATGGLTPDQLEAAVEAGVRKVLTNGIGATS